MFFAHASAAHAGPRHKYALEVLSFWEQLKWIFFNRLPAPPKRLDLTQEVLGTTQTEPRGPAAIQGGLGADAATRPAIGGIPRSARGRARPRAVATPRGGAPRRPTGEKYIQYPYQNFENRVLENPKNAFGAEFNSGPNAFVRILIPATQFERRIFFKMFLTSDIRILSRLSR